MSANRELKVKEVEELKANLQAQEIVVVTHNMGLTVKQVTEFRSSLRKEGASLKVVKNTLARRALEGTKFADVSKYLSGPTGIVSAADPLVAARVTYNFAKDNEKLVILGGQSTEGPLDPAAIKTLALLPSLDTLRGMLVGLLQAPGAQLARLAKDYADKGGDAAATPAAAAPAEAAPAT